MERKPKFQDWTEHDVVEYGRKWLNIGDRVIKQMIAKRISGLFIVSNPIKLAYQIFDLWDLNSEEKKQLKELYQFLATNKPESKDDKFINPIDPLNDEIPQEGTISKKMEQTQLIYNYYLPSKMKYPFKSDQGLVYDFANSHLKDSDSQSKPASEVSDFFIQPAIQFKDAESKDTPEFGDMITKGLTFNSEKIEPTLKLQKPSKQIKESIITLSYSLDDGVTFKKKTTFHLNFINSTLQIGRSSVQSFEHFYSISHPQVSKTHAKIERDKQTGSLYLVEHTGYNGTYVQCQDLEKLTEDSEIILEKQFINFQSINFSNNEASTTVEVLNTSNPKEKPQIFKVDGINGDKKELFTSMYVSKQYDEKNQPTLCFHSELASLSFRRLLDRKERYCIAFSQNILISAPVFLKIEFESTPIG